jgi:hypothetical protein
MRETVVGRAAGRRADERVRPDAEDDCRYNGSLAYDEQLSHLYPIRYEDLPSKTQQIIETASGDGRYETCSPKSDALKSVIDEVENRIDRQWEEYGGEPENRPEYLRTAYLHRDASYFELEVTVEDLVLSG